MTFSFIKVLVAMKVVVLLRIYHQHGPMVGIHFRAIGFDVLREMAHRHHQSGVAGPHLSYIEAISGLAEFESAGPMVGIHYRAIGFDVLREMAQRHHQRGVAGPHLPYIEAISALAEFAGGGQSTRPMVGIHYRAVGFESVTGPRLPYIKAIGALAGFASGGQSTRLQLEHITDSIHFSSNQRNPFSGAE